MLQIQLNLDNPENDSFLRSIIREELENLIPEGGTPKTEVLSQKDLCLRLNISAPKLIQMRKDGLIPFMPVGNKIRYNLPEVIRALTEQGYR